jgi:hypothetical protein
MRVKRNLRAWIDEAIIKLLHIRLLDRIIGYLAYQRRRMTRRRVEALLEAKGSYPDEVVRGPFRGMRLPGKAHYIDCRFEKVVGAYEHELFEIVAGLPSASPPFDDVVVIGAADGFYAVGLALLLPDARIWAYERDVLRGEMLEKVSSENGVSERVRLMGDCSNEKLNTELPTGHALIFCDVDGYENTLLDPVSVPNLRASTMVVETHDCFVPGISNELKHRFSGSHSIQEIHMCGPDFGTLPELTDLKLNEVESLVGSDRPTLQTWLVLLPKIRVPHH